MSRQAAHEILRLFGSILWLFSLYGCSIAETLLCGAVSYQVVFEPSRPIFSSTFVAAAAATAAAASNDGVGASGSTFAIPIARYTYRPLEQIVPGDVSLCRYNYSSPYFMPVLDAGESRTVITTCAECARCTHDLATAHRLLSRAAVDAGLQSLLIVVRSPSGDVEENSPLRAIERIRLVENSPAKFVFIDEEPGQLRVCELMAGGIENDALKNFSKTSVLFVSISFIILMIISLAWLVFYYVQRFRYAHAKDRLQRRLFNAAKKALANTPTRPIKSGDKNLDTDCPVCIDPYKIGDIVRILPCRHTFHKSCVDPWLLEHRTCPMCKSDILKAYGYHISTSSTSSVGSAGGRRRAQFSGAGSVPTLETNISASGEFHYYPYHGRQNQRRTRPHRTSLAAAAGRDGGRRPHHVRSATIAGDVTVISAYEGMPRASSLDHGDSVSSDSNSFPFTVINEIHDPFKLSATSNSPRMVKIFDTKNLRHLTFAPPILGEVAVNPISVAMAADELANVGDDGNTLAGYGRYATGAESSSNVMPTRQIYSSEGQIQNAPARFFRTSTATCQPQLQQPSFQIIHTNSRSLNNGHFPIELPPAQLAIESNKNNYSIESERKMIEESVKASADSLEKTTSEDLTRSHSTS